MVDEHCYPRDGVSINYTENDFIDQYRDIKLFLHEYIVEPKLIPIISYPDMKTKYSIGIKGLGHQADQPTLKKVQLFQENGTDPDNGRLFLILIRQREVELLCDENKLMEVKVIYMKILNFEDFMKKYYVKSDTITRVNCKQFIFM